MCGFLVMSGERFADEFDAALGTLGHRGPDDRGEWADPALPLRMGHCRLSVIDIEGGAQPMHSADERYVLVYNGEIYNFRELRSELEAAGRSFRTDHSDTEVLLEGYAAWSEDLLTKLDGMFAFVIYDRHEQMLFAARDRFGIKPLYYAGQGGLTLSSTLEPFYRLTDFSQTLDYESVREYLAVQSIPSPRTILREVRSLLPAHWLRYDLREKSLQTGQYWHIPSATDKPLEFDELVEVTDAALRDSVKRQLVADVPLGAFLSGGIDSALMVHYMAEAAGDVKTFTVRFPQQFGYDESAIAKQVATKYATDHHEYDARDIDGEELQLAIAELDQPLADPAYLPLRALSQLTQQHVTVAIAGDGGDELFGGYPRYQNVELSYPDSELRSLLRAITQAGVLPGNLLRRFLAGKEKLLWDRVKFGPFPRTRKDMARLLATEAQKRARIDETMLHWLEQAQQFASPIDSDALMRADLWTYLSENCLVKTDRASMAHSLEVRVPMLGNPVVDVVLPQPGPVKLRGGLKAVLRTLAERHLPREVWDRPKHGFSVPVRNYVRGPWYKQARQWFDHAEELAPFLDPLTMKRHWRQGQLGRGDPRSLYTLITLLGWLATHEVKG